VRVEREHDESPERILKQEVIEMMMIIKRQRQAARRALAFVLTLALVTLSSAGVALAQEQSFSSGDLREEFHQTYRLAPGGRVSLENITGTVRVVGWDRDEVKVDAVKRANMAEKLAEAEIRVDATADSVRIKTRYPTGSTSWSFDGDRPRADNPASVDYTLSVPRGARIDSIETINGALDLEGLNGDVIASSINGKLTARRLTGEVKLSVINGRLEATFDRLDNSKPLTLSSVNGPVVLFLPSDAQADLRASTVHGAINNDFNLPVRKGEYVGRDLAGRLGAGGTRVKVNNVNGSINIRRASDGRQLSPATNLLSETNNADERRADEEVREAEREAREAAREAADAEREARRAQREAERESQRAVREATDAAREAQREAQEAAREAVREAQRARQEAQRLQAEAQREAQQAQREAQREAIEAQREAQEAAREAARDVARASAEVAREATRAAAEATRALDRGHVVISNDQRQIERESNSFQTTGTPRVTIKNFDGPITVRAWDKPEVMYTAVKRAWDDKEMKGIKVTTRAENRRSTTRSDSGAVSSSSGSEVNISTEFDKAFAHDVVRRNGRIEVFSSAASVELEVYVPRNALLNVSSGDGRLRVEGVGGELELHTRDGAVDVSGGRGRVRVDTGDGAIRIIDFDGEANATTGDGRITLEGRFTRLGARTGDGTISLAIPSDSNVTIETDSDGVANDGWAEAEGPDAGRVRRWRIGRGGEVFRLRTGDGQVVLRQR
jgi:DUF4097 and DUF4098 domain-containing protein YvlB